MRSWLAEGTVWPGGEEGYVLPTCMKAIVRQLPPPRPAGLGRASWDTQQRWMADQYRYPPYQYGQEFLFWTASFWRLANSGDRELLLGYGWGHTELAWSASDIKRNPRQYEDVRCSLLGDSFSIHSFVIAGAAMMRSYLPRIHYKHLCRRMGVAPGFRLPIRFEAPLCRYLSYGDMGNVDEYEIRQLNGIFLSRVNHTGFDVRIASGEIINPRTFPYQSVESEWLQWQILFKTLWHLNDHINVLEMRGILLAVKYCIVHLQCHDVRLVHFFDSYVAMAIIGKGRAASGKMSWTLKQLNGLLLMFNLQLLMAHVESTKNPTDNASRE